MSLIQGFLGVIVCLFRPSSDLRQNSNLQVNILTSKVYDILIENTEMNVNVEINMFYIFRSTVQLELLAILMLVD